MPDLNTRLSLYLRLAKVTWLGALDELEGELEDRFGSLPVEVKDLLYLVKIKLLGSIAGIESISIEDEQVVLTLSAAVGTDRQQLQRAFSGRFKIGMNRLRLDIGREDREWKDELLQGLKRMAQFRDNSQSPQGSVSVDSP